MSSANVHRRQVFHWIGKHIDQNGGLTADQRRAAYLDALAGSLVDGLWMNRLGEELGFRGAPSHTLERRAVCFTENRLSDCRFHASRYGHLGLGFPKRFVLDAGGKPVSYVEHKVGDLYTRSLFSALTLAVTSKRGEELDFVLHFVKPLRHPPQPRVTPGAGGATGARPPAGPPDAAVMRRHFGKPIAIADHFWQIYGNIFRDLSAHGIVRGMVFRETKITRSWR